MSEEVRGTVEIRDFCKCGSFFSYAGPTAKGFSYDPYGLERWRHEHLRACVEMQRAVKAEQKKHGDGITCPKALGSRSMFDCKHGRSRGHNEFAGLNSMIRSTLWQSGIHTVSQLERSLEAGIRIDGLARVGKQRVNEFLEARKVRTEIGQSTAI